MIPVPDWMYELDAKDLPEQYTKLSSVVGYDGLLALISNYSGDYLYIPKLDGLIRLTRDDKIMHDYINGVPIKEIAHKYNLALAPVYRIIDTQKRKSQIDGEQVSLLDMVE